MGLFRKRTPAPAAPTRTAAVCAHAHQGGCAGPVTHGPDPFAAEVAGDTTPMWMCEHHRERSFLDI